MKLRYREQFAGRAGSIWRLIFVCALFPWLHEYRVQARPGINQTDIDNQANFPDLNYVSQRDLKNSMDETDEETDSDVDVSGSGRKMDPTTSTRQDSVEPKQFARPRRSGLAMDEEDYKRLKELEDENFRLKAVVAEYLRREGIAEAKSVC